MQQDCDVDRRLRRDELLALFLGKYGDVPLDIIEFVSFIRLRAGSCRVYLIHGSHLPRIPSSNEFRVSC